MDCPPRTGAWNVSFCRRVSFVEKKTPTATLDHRGLRKTSAGPDYAVSAFAGTLSALKRASASFLSNVSPRNDTSGV